jgi:hypothetical protein
MPRVSRTKTEIIQCTYKGQPARVVTCLSPEQANELRGRWPDGVVPIERLHETALLTNATSRAWLVRTVCQILKIKDWRAVVRECTGESELPEAYEHERPLRIPKTAALPAAAAPSARRVSRTERFRGGRESR